MQHIQTMLTLLFDIQASMSTARFHLMLETDVASDENRRTLTECRVIFSPTVDANCGRTSGLLLRAVGFMSLVSKTASTASDASTSPPQQEPQQSQAVVPESTTGSDAPNNIPPPALLLASQHGEGVRNLCLFPPQFPAWFPGKRYSDASTRSAI